MWLAGNADQALSQAVIGFPAFSFSEFCYKPILPLLKGRAKNRIVANGDLA
jgi:hypothetical protein